MTTKLLLPILLIVLCFGCKKKDTGSQTSIITTTKTDTTFGQPNNEHISVLTQHNDNTRAGLNSRETALTTSNVKEPAS